MIGGLRALTTAPFMALSASALPEIEATIIDSLKLDNPVQVSKRLDRPNIYLSLSPMSGLKVSEACPSGCITCEE